MTKKKKIIIIVIIVLILLLGCLGFFYITQKNKSSKKNINKSIETIEKFNYTLKSNDPKIKKEKFKELKDILSKKDIDYEEYAKKLAEIFAIDVYYLDCKISKYDIGGLEYILDSERSKFKSLMQDTLYSNIVDNSDDKRSQQLPIVTNVTSSDFKKTSYKYKDKEYSAYSVKIKIDYEEDLGYDKEVLITIMKNESKLYVVVVNPV